MFRIFSRNIWKVKETVWWSQNSKCIQFLSSCMENIFVNFCYMYSSGHYKLNLSSINAYVSKPSVLYWFQIVLRNVEIPYKPIYYEYDCIRKSHQFIIGVLNMLLLYDNWSLHNNYISQFISNFAAVQSKHKNYFLTCCWF